MTEDVGLSALLFIGFVSQWWVLLILGAHPRAHNPRLPCRCTALFRHHNKSINVCHHCHQINVPRCANAVHVVADQSYKLTKGVAKFLVAVYVVFVGVCALAVALKWRF